MNAKGRGARVESIAELLRRPVPEGRRREVAGLFAGIGGLELGLARAGHATALLCELEPGAQAVLRSRMPEIPLASDVRELARLPRGTELLSAGFPCQDLSQAGRTAGIRGERSGLVGEVLRLIAARPVPWVLLENVPFMLQLERGRAMEHIAGRVEALGYRWAYRTVNTRAFGLPQRRQRVIFLAALSADPRAVLLADDAGPPAARPASRARPACGFYWTEGTRGLGWAVNAVPTLKGGSSVGIPSPPAIWMPAGEIVTPEIRDAERLQGFAADWTAPAERVVRPSGRWKLVGNAVTVELAHWIGVRLGTPGAYEGGADAPLPRGAAWPSAAWSDGTGRFRSEVSPWPVRRSATPLAEFLRHPTRLLSARATAGFLRRFKAGALRQPPGFVEALERHLGRMAGSGERSRRAS